MRVREGKEERSPRRPRSKNRKILLIAFVAPHMEDQVPFDTVPGMEPDEESVGIQF